MSYVAVKGGTRAVEQAEQLLNYYRLRGGSSPIEVRQIQDQLRLGVDRVMSEGSLYSPFHAALAIKQAEGDMLEATFILRAYRSTLSRVYDSLVVDTTGMDVIRRISAAFQDVPGGQILGPTPDYTQRLLNFDLCEESDVHVKEFLGRYLEDLLPAQDEPAPSFPKVIEILQDEGMILVPDRLAGKDQDEDPAGKPYDITRDPLIFPAPRSARLQALTRGETGGLLAMAYSSMRGYGDVHPTIGELRVGYISLCIPHPESGDAVFAGRVLVTEAEVIASFQGHESETGPRFTVGYGLCFGQNETKAIAMAVLDRSMSKPAERAPISKMPAEDEEFVLSHIDGVESSGFALHYKLPHYVTFQSDQDRLKFARCFAGERRGDLAGDR